MTIKNKLQNETATLPPEPTPAEAAAVNQTPEGKKTEKPLSLSIKAPNFKYIMLSCRGGPDGILVIRRFSEKSLTAIEEQQKEGSTARTKKPRKARNFRQEFEDAQHKSAAGWQGVAMMGLKKGLVSACRLTDISMQLGKICFFVQADGYDERDGTPLLRIYGSEPEMFKSYVRPPGQNTMLCVRALFRNWEIRPRIRYDADRFTPQDILNLVARVGMQIGIGEGRADSPKSPGQDWGFFEVVPDIGIENGEEEKAA